MKLADIINEDNFEMSPQQRMLGNIGRILMAQAEQVKDDALANTMAKVGNEMTNMGALFGPNSLKDLEKKTDVPAAVIQKLIQYGKKIHDATKDIKADHKDGGLNDSIQDNDLDQPQKARLNIAPLDPTTEKKIMRAISTGKFTNIRGLQGLAKQYQVDVKAVIDLFNKSKQGMRPGHAKKFQYETTSAGGVAAVAMPMGNVISRTGPKKKKKSKRSQINSIVITIWSIIMTDKIKEGLAALADVAERDHEVQMARSDLYKIAKYAIKLHEMMKNISEAEGIEGWQQAKITKAADYLGSVYHALDYETKFESVQVPAKAAVKRNKPVMSEDEFVSYKGSLASKLAETKNCPDCGKPSYKTFGLSESELDEGKKKGVDGKACWKGYRYAGTEGGKDKCVKVKRRKKKK